MSAYAAACNAYIRSLILNMFLMEMPDAYTERDWESVLEYFQTKTMQRYLDAFLPVLMY